MIRFLTGLCLLMLAFWLFTMMLPTLLGIAVAIAMALR